MPGVVAGSYAHQTTKAMPGVVSRGYAHQTTKAMPGGLGYRKDCLGHKFSRFYLAECRFKGLCPSDDQGYAGFPPLAGQGYASAASEAMPTKRRSYRHLMTLTTRLHAERCV